MTRNQVIAALLGALAAALLTGPPSTLAEQLPLRRYGVYEGLPHSSARCILQDSRGYLWIGTADGLARFDGYHFAAYDTKDGLGHPYINSIAEDRQGRVWVATNGGGVSCFVDWAPKAVPRAGQTIRASAKFITFKLSDQPESNRVDSLLFDSDGRLWCGTDAGLYRAIVPSEKLDTLQFEQVVAHPPDAIGTGAFADSRGRLWFGNGNMIVEAIGDRIISYGPEAEFGHEILSFAEDRQGRMRAINEHGLFEFVEAADSADPIARGRWNAAPVDLSKYGSLRCLETDEAGCLWIGAEHGLIKYERGKQTIYTTGNGLTNDFVHSLCRDRDRNLWIGTDNGLCMLSGQPAVGFGRSDGLPDAPVVHLFTDRTGHVFVSTGGAGMLEMSEGRAVPIKWSQAPAFKEIGQRIRQDRQGDWWIGTNRGLFWFHGPDLARARGRQISPAEGGPAVGIVGQISEDSRGRLWFGSQDDGLFCIERPKPSGNAVVRRVLLTYKFPYRRVISDRNGDLWLAAQSLLSRVVDGRDTLLRPSEGEPDIAARAKAMWDQAEPGLPRTEGLPEISPRAFFLDSRGWLWIGLRNSGISVTKDPSGDPVKFDNYSMTDGLASNTVWSIAEDDSGQMYLGTGRGLDRLDPGTGHIRHITAGEKLVGDSIIQCMKDSVGNIWVSTSNSILKLDPRAEADQGRAPPVYLTKLQVAGSELPLPDAGATEGPSLTLGPSGNNLLIEFVGLDFHSDRELKYQYRLDGVDADWSPPTDQRSVNYASLGAGSYRFMVRAVNQQGTVTPEPAIVQIRILPPIWRRWWFLTAAATLLLLGAYAAHRRRVARLVELLTVRTRIASDLHDDIGANLTKIAILSEVAYQQLGSRFPLPGSPLTAIARISRESVASMGDIVWAIDPRRDTDQDLIRRMRQFAIEMLAGAGVEVRVVVSGDEQPRRVGPDFRRQVFLIFKEAVHNAARHSGCSKVDVDIQMERAGLSIRIQDDGTGFDIARESEGQGLTSMDRRAKSLRGSVKVASGDQGTTVTLSVPWAR